MSFTFNMNSGNVPHFQFQNAQNPGTRTQTSSTGSSNVGQSNITPLTPDALKHCVCQYCNCYANVCPVRLVNNKVACGRCTTPGDGVQLFIVEALMKLHVFPCRYDMQGCKVNVTQSSVEGHEKSCDFKSVKCTVTDCKWTGTKNSIMIHFQNAHEEKVINAKTAIKLDLTKLESDNFLYLQNINPYYVFFKKGDKVLTHSIRSFCTDLEALRYSYSIKLLANNKELIFNNFKILSYDQGDQHINDAISLHAIEAVFGDLNNLDVYVSVQQSDIGLESFSASDIECPVCMEVMKGMIFVRKCGHSLCGQCNNNLQNSICPICRNGSTRTLQHIGRGNVAHQDIDLRIRNYSLEMLVKKLHSTNMI